MTRAPLLLALLALLALAACTAAPAATPRSAEPAPTPPAVEESVTAEPATEPPAPALPRHCAAVPSACDFPDATTTGVVPGVQLTVVQGPLVIEEDGALIEGLEVHGSIDVAADHVTIRNVRVVQDGESWGIGLRGARDTTIEDCEVRPRGKRLLVGIKDAYGDARGTTIQRCDISGVTTGIQVHEGLVADNYVHDLAWQDGDHLNAVTSNGSRVPLTIHHNTLFNPVGQTDAVGLFQDFGVEANRTVTDNLLAGGGYVVYGGDGDRGQSSGIVVSGNRFARLFFHRGGQFGPVAHFDASGPGNVWADNVWDDTLEEVPAP